MSTRSPRFPALSWSTDDMPDLAGRTAVVTGAASGLGLAVTRSLIAHGARVVMAVRNTAKAEQMRAEFAQGPGEAVGMELDLLDLTSVHRFTAAVHERFTAVDLLIENAGISSQSLVLSPEGVESQFATNHLGHFALTGPLLDLLGNGHDPRIVVVASALYARADLDLDRLDGSGTYSPGRAYNRSKLANVLFGRELQRRLQASGSTVRSFVAHPGMAKTPLHTTYPSPALRLVTKTAAALIGRPAEHAAVPILYAATSPDASPDSFYGPTGPKLHPQVRPGAFTGPGLDRDASCALWATSQQLTGVQYLDY
ncbi:SDR family NAD(P)-dependent oxidoreductase [Streptomyces lunaelactis]|uniref:SDR family NAD(P)-dependent oxidoreductase n=1 Tax=Streptomyces lunaelactis TaxID=1535768 RepID=UPI001584AA83|nr:SDR family NAD(P)-dependent oxidoreductase [Streptomyces lunaelactis]NUL05641.1 SDR family NAD(P)-dependent oxidoreductase [Streptomyces lunaelactis]